jgi:hypothetical protein
MPWRGEPPKSDSKFERSLPRKVDTILSIPERSPIP